MKKLFSLIFGFGLMLAAFGPAGPAAAALAETFEYTLTPNRTATDIPPTSTITPLPTIPAFTLPAHTTHRHAKS